MAPPSAVWPVLLVQLSEVHSCRAGNNCALYIYPIVKGFQFASATKAACLSDNEAQLARGFASLSAMVKFFGILTIVILVFYVLALLGAGALFAGMSMVK